MLYAGRTVSVLQVSLSVSRSWSCKMIILKFILYKPTLMLVRIIFFSPVPFILFFFYIYNFCIPHNLCPKMLENIFISLYTVCHNMFCPYCLTIVMFAWNLFLSVFVNFRRHFWGSKFGPGTLRPFHLAGTSLADQWTGRLSTIILCEWASDECKGRGGATVFSAAFPRRDGHSQRTQ